MIRASSPTIPRISKCIPEIVPASILPEAISNTLEIAEKCNLVLKLDSTSSEKYPQYQPPGEKTREQFFRDLCWEGLRQRYGERADTDPELRKLYKFAREMEGLFEKHGTTGVAFVIADGEVNRYGAVPQWRQLFLADAGSINKISRDT